MAVLVNLATLNLLNNPLNNVSAEPYSAIQSLENLTSLMDGCYYVIIITEFLYNEKYSKTFITISHSETYNLNL